MGLDIMFNRALTKGEYDELREKRIAENPKLLTTESYNLQMYTMTWDKNEDLGRYEKFRNLMSIESRTWIDYAATFIKYEMIKHAKEMIDESNYHYDQVYQIGFYEALDDKDESVIKKYEHVSVYVSTEIRSQSYTTRSKIRETCDRIRALADSPEFVETGYLNQDGVILLDEKHYIKKTENLLTLHYCEVDWHQKHVTDAYYHFLSTDEEGGDITEYSEYKEILCKNLVGDPDGFRCLKWDSQWDHERSFITNSW